MRNAALSIRPKLDNNGIAFSHTHLNVQRNQRGKFSDDTLTMEVRNVAQRGDECKAHFHFELHVLFKDSGRYWHETGSVLLDDQQIDALIEKLTAHRKPQA